MRHLFYGSPYLINNMPDAVQDIFILLVCAVESKLSVESLAV